MNPRHTPLQSWERAALERYAQQYGVSSLHAGAFWHTYGVMLRNASTSVFFTRSHRVRSASRLSHSATPLAAVKIENRLYSLFAE